MQKKRKNNNSWIIKNQKGLSAIVSSLIIILLVLVAAGIIWVVVRAKTKRETERVGKYMIRPLLSLKRLFFDETGGKVRYQYSRYGSEEESMDYLELIARVTSHIPERVAKYGWDSRDVDMNIFY